MLQTYFKIFKKVNDRSTLLSFCKFLWFDRGEGEGLGEGRAIRGIRTTAKVEINPATFAYLIGYLCWRKVFNNCPQDFWLYSGAPNENIVQNHLNIALLNVFKYLNGG